MSMQVEFRGISARALEAWLRVPALSYPIVRMSDEAPASFRKEEENYEDAMQSVLRELSGNPGAEEAFDEDLDSQLLLDAGLEPSDFESRFLAGDYRVLDPMLAGRPALAPLHQALLGGIEHGDDVGYGPMRYHQPVSVRRIFEGLRAIDTDQLGSVEPWLPELVLEVRARYERASTKAGAIALYLV